MTLSLRKIKIVSRKYDGRLRDEYESYLYSEDAEKVITFSPPGTPYFWQKQNAWLTSTDGLLEIYFKQAWYNVWHICEQNSQVNRMYINIAMPASLQDNVLTWTDLDLDLRLQMDGSLTLLDEDEFQENIVAMHYSPEVIAQAYAACEQLKACYAGKRYPFTHAEHCALYASIKQNLVRD